MTINSTRKRRTLWKEGASFAYAYRNGGFGRLGGLLAVTIGLSAGAP